MASDEFPFGRDCRSRPVPPPPFGGRSGHALRRRGAL